MTQLYAQRHFPGWHLVGEELGSFVGLQLVGSRSQGLGSLSALEECLTGSGSSAEREQRWGVELRLPQSAQPRAPGHRVAKQGSQAGDTEHWRAPWAAPLRIRCGLQWLGPPRASGHGLSWLEQKA